MDTGHMKRCSISLTMREMKIKTTVRYHFTLVKMAITKKPTNNKCWRGVARRDPSCTRGMYMVQPQYGGSLS